MDPNRFFDGLPGKAGDGKAIMANLHLIHKRMHGFAGAANYSGGKELGGIHVPGLRVAGVV
jgi:hypothetical protein